MKSLVVPCFITLALVLAGCQKPIAQAPDIRPVRVLEVAAVQAASVYEYAGEIRPRIESRLGFRVPGKIISRQVDVGALVTRGQSLAVLDAQDLQLAQDAAKAQLAAARVDHSLATADLRRFAELRNKGFISAADLERRQSTVDAARARLDQAEAQATQQGNQARYTTLVSDVAGVVTAIEAEAGQVVAAGQPVIRVAVEGAKEVLFSIPEDKVALLRRMNNIEVRTWAQPDQPLKGVVREISPLADPATRTFAVRVTLTKAPADVLLGMTATVRFIGAPGAPRLTVPLSAVVNSKERNAVWVLDPSSATVALVPVVLGSNSGDNVVVTQGLEAGVLVVTAGVHKLLPGQKVTRLAEGAVGSQGGGRP